MMTFESPTAFDLTFGFTGLVICAVAGTLLYLKRRERRRGLMMSSASSHFPNRHDSKHVLELHIGGSEPKGTRDNTSINERPGSRERNDTVAVPPSKFPSYIPAEGMNPRLTNAFNSRAKIDRFLGTGQMSDDRRRY